MLESFHARLMCILNEEKKKQNLREEALNITDVMNCNPTSLDKTSNLLTKHHGHHCANCTCIKIRIEERRAQIINTQETPDELIMLSHNKLFSHDVFDIFHVECTIMQWL